MNRSLTHLLDQATAKKKKLDQIRPLPPALIANLQQWFKVELTYSSNALEGNALTSSETALVIEKGITIGGKSVREHLEAINHAFAFDFIMQLVSATKHEIQLNDILDIHRLILREIDDEHAGRLRTIMVRVSGSQVKFPDPVKVPELMEQFISWLHTTDEHPVLVAANAHLRLVTIHPFVDGNGRTARLLMNLLLMQAGYPPAIISPKQRPAYINSLEQAQLKNDPAAYHELILHVVNESLDIYLDAASRTI
jgi:Fic family protein